jgi:hypothetical protein
MRHLLALQVQHGRRNQPAANTPHAPAPSPAASALAFHWLVSPLPAFAVRCRPTVEAARLPGDHPVRFATRCGLHRTQRRTRQRDVMEKQSLRYPPAGQMSSFNHCFAGNAHVSQKVPQTMKSHIRRVDATVSDADRSSPCPKLDKSLANDIAPREIGCSTKSLRDRIGSHPGNRRWVLGLPSPF